MWQDSHLRGEQEKILLYKTQNKEGDMHPVRYNPRVVRTEAPSRLPLERVLDEEFPFPGLRIEPVGASAWVPPVDFVEDKNQYTILMDAPGMAKADVHVNYRDGILYVYGKRAHEKEVGDEKATTYLVERRCGGFMRHFHLHAPVLHDKIRADYRNGILKIVVPKNKKAASKHVAVKIN